jgi:hypothetical protein
MTSVQEAAAHAAAEQASKDLAKKRAQAKPNTSLLHHIAATQAMGTGFTVTLLDGTSYKRTGNLHICRSRPRRLGPASFV